MSYKTQLEKGCGAWSRGIKKGVVFETPCGNDGFKDEICLCEVCRAKLEGYNQARKEELNLLEFLDDDKKSKEPLPSWAKFAVTERIKELKD